MFHVEQFITSTKVRGVHHKNVKGRGDGGVVVSLNSYFIKIKKLKFLEIKRRFSRIC